MCLAYLLWQCKRQGGGVCNGQEGCAKGRKGMNGVERVCKGQERYAKGGKGM